jgi:hypothetical protein
MVRIGGGRSKGWYNKPLGILLGQVQLWLTAPGCRTCRRRRVKCDERHPTCERCEKGSFDCEGYTQEHRFVDEVARTIRHAQKVSAKQKSQPAAGSRDLTPYSSKGQGLRLNMSLTGLQDNTFISFLLSNIFAGMVWSPWMLNQAKNITSVTAQNCILALGKVYFGRMHRRQDIISQGFVIYGDALKSLNHDLEDEENACSLSVLTSAMTLQIYEVRKHSVISLIEPGLKI